MTTPPPPERIALYRLFDAEGQLLYIGITDNPTRRWRRHSKDKEWWPEVTKLTIAWCETRAAAQRAELDAIRSEAPRHNQVGTRAEEAQDDWEQEEREPLAFDMLRMQWA